MADIEEFMSTRTQLRKEILAADSACFESLALKVFHFQVRYNPLYRAYVGALRRGKSEITDIRDIPFLPVSLFKKHQVFCGTPGSGSAIFESSGTTGGDTSRHVVSDLGLYESLSVRLFESRYGLLQNYHVLALLPSYLERSNSSLVYMVQHFMKVSGSVHSGFYLHDFNALNQQIERILQLNDGRKVMLIGVTFALLDWAEEYARQSGKGFDTSRLIVMETGGMKGRRKEMLRVEVHDILKQFLSIGKVHSEYGMTELVSQAYSSGAGLFKAEGSLRILMRDITDPLTVGVERQTGGVNVIDLGNLDSCAFIETSDLGRLDPVSETFEIVGRLDNADIRGCNLLYV